MLLDFIKNAYDTFEQYHISVTALIAVSLILFIALLFAMREAASWFFKIDDIKRDVRKLHQLTVELEAEIRAVQELVAQTTLKNQTIEDIKKVTPSPTPLNSQAQAAAKSTSFPFSH